ncbi:N-formylglutamate deformylase [Defluviimonas sp. WL0075]|uniref:N-formylglutamate deformylase n=1 Tax=Albidovulum sediminicola TaxID=2984331 RepID=A0ABT2Z3H5_9RHOB|nr:N-formylglutamate deformylase [Defluviimonas sp. WL0075]MCV2865555.1 N-formylglutamate deformylase [Defluviimonas sp. WL0075]
MQPFVVTQGDSPVILGMPHGGTWLPDDLTARLNPTGRALADTDWHIAALYQGLLPGATVVASTVHRYAIDANRDPAGVSLYPGQNTTTLCPLTDFDGNPIWQPGQPPSEDEVRARRAAFHAPYHAALQAEIDRVRARHGVAILYDCHSIRSRIPFLFDGLLPVFSIGTNGGETCAHGIEAATLTRCAEAEGFTHVLNGRFKGGWSTRHYGQPAKGVHAIQMELAQRAYLTAEAAPWAYDPAHAAPLRAVLGAILSDLDTLARSGALS